MLQIIKQHSGASAEVNTYRTTREYIQILKNEIPTPYAHRLADILVLIYSLKQNVLCFNTVVQLVFCSALNMIV